MRCDQLLVGQTNRRDLTDVFGSVLPHTLDIKGLLFTDGGASQQLYRRDAGKSGRVFTVGHCSISPYSEAVLHCTVRTVAGVLCPLVGCWRASPFLQRTLVSSSTELWYIHPGGGFRSSCLTSVRIQLW